MPRPLLPYRAIFLATSFAPWHPASAIHRGSAVLWVLLAARPVRNNKPAVHIPTAYPLRHPHSFLDHTFPHLPYLICHLASNKGMYFTQTVLQALENFLHRL